MTPPSSSSTSRAAARVRPWNSLSDGVNQRDALARSFAATGVETAMSVILRPLAYQSGQRLTAARGCSGYASAKSEEHTSELQSLMRISYAVFCLKNKTTK